MAFIYKIENKVNKKKYIGKTRRTDVTVRWDEHIKALNAGNHYNRHLQNAWKKYGFANFDFSIVSEYPVDYDEKLLADAEIKYIDFFDSYRNGYNLTVASIGDEEPVFWKYSVAKMGFTHNGKQQYVICDRNTSPLIISIDKDYLESFLPLLNNDEELGLKAIEKADRFKYSVAKMGFTSNGKQQYVIYDRNNSPLINSIDKTYLESFLPLLNSDEELGLKAIKEAQKFKYSVAKNGFNSNGKQKYVICDRNNSQLIISIDKEYLEFVVELLNSNESKWIVEKNGKFKLRNKKLLKELFNNYDCEVLV